MDLFNGTPGATDGTTAGIRVGIGGWTYAPWGDNFYPKRLVQRRELEHASRHVTSIEINGTYYGTQAPATYARGAMKPRTASCSRRRRRSGSSRRAC